MPDTSHIPAYRAISAALIERGAAQAEVLAIPRSNYIDRQCEAALRRASDAGIVTTSGRGCASGLNAVGVDIEDAAYECAALAWANCEARVAALMATGLSRTDAVDVIFEGPALSDEECEIYEMMCGRPA